MINKRGRLIAIIGGGFFLVLIVMQNIKKDSLGKDSFYKTFSSSGEEFSIRRKDKKAASLGSDEEELKTSSESYQQTLKRNKKDKAFSLYKEILAEPETKVEEKVVKYDSTKVEAPEKKEPEKKVVYVYKPAPKQEVPQEPVQEPVKKRSFTRYSSSRNQDGSTTKSEKNAVASIYIEAEIYRGVNVDLAYPQIIDIRVLAEDPVSLPNGKKIKPGMMLKGVPSDGTNVLNIEVPEYSLVVYEAKGIEGIPLTASEGLKEEADNLANTEVSTNVNLPVVGSMRLTSGKKRASRKVYLSESRTILLKWEGK